MDTNTSQISQFHATGNFVFELPEFKAIQQKFLKGEKTQEKLVSEIREGLIPILCSIQEDECLTIEAWLKDGIVFDCSYSKKAISYFLGNQCEDEITKVLKSIKIEYADFIPVVFVFYESSGEKSTHLSFGFDLIEKPFSWGKGKRINKINKPHKPKEDELEKELIDWLFSYGIQADRQVKTTKHRMDVWIPSKCFLELKRDKVNGDDVCQAIDYCSEYKMPIVIVGNNISDMASRGIVAFNKAIGADLICFVQWSAIRTYLKGMLNLMR